MIQDGDPNVKSDAISMVSVGDGLTSSEKKVSVYEGLLQEIEAEVRGHIRFQQQLKLHIETVEQRLEYVESEYDKLNKENA